MSLTPVDLGLLAGALSLAFGTLLVWRRFRPQSHIDAAVAMARRGVSAVSRILVPVRGSAYNERAVELACRLGAEQKAEIVVAYVIEVPLALPLSAPLEAEERRAEDCLARAVGIISRHGLHPKTSIARERDVARGILKVAKDEHVAMVVLGINPKNLAAGDSVGQATEQLLRKSDIEVIVDMHPEPAA
jgi:nucleotide-binding universal stress UspA family protein